jgi:hypothetical protein
MKKRQRKKLLKKKLKKMTPLATLLKKKNTCSPEFLKTLNDHQKDVLA